MKRVLVVLMLLFTISGFAQCLSNIQDQGNNNATPVTLSYYDASGVLLGTCNCTLAGSSGNLNCPSACLFNIPGTNFSTVIMDGCVYSSDGVLISALPIELVNFKCEVNSDNITINWTTASETNNKEFQLWRSIDGIYWTKIHYIQGAGTSTSYRTYSYADYFLFTSIYYYKLVQVDFDGKSTTSKISSCSFVMSTSSGITITYYNMLEQKVDINKSVHGYYIKEYDNGSIIRRELYYKPE